MAETAVKAGDAVCEEARGRELRWDSQAEALMRLFGSVWGRDRITGRDYFEWQFLEGPKGKPIAYCAQPDREKAPLAGIYLVMPATLLSGSGALDFSISVYTATHPAYRKQGIFRDLALLTYEKCRERSISGTVGIPNNNSLPGFRGLGFTVLGQMEVVARLASPFAASEAGPPVRQFTTARNLCAIDCGLDRAKARSGTVLFERGAEFLAWRYLRCPGIRYRIFGCVDRGEKLVGLIVLRSARRKGLPLTVIVDFLVNETAPDADLTARALLRQAHLFAWTRLAPVVITLVNPFSHEARMLAGNGFRSMWKKMLPHESNLILKLHTDGPPGLARQLTDFRNWHFSFGDYDIF